MQNYSIYGSIKFEIWRSLRCGRDDTIKGQDDIIKSLDEIIKG